MTTSTMTGMSSHKQTEPGYKAVLIRECTKASLVTFRQALREKDVYQERRLASAAVQLLLNRPDLHSAWLAVARDVLRAELDQPESAAALSA